LSDFSALGYALDYDCTFLTFVTPRLATSDSGKYLDSPQQAKYDGCIPLEFAPIRLLKWGSS